MDCGGGGGALLFFISTWRFGFISGGREEGSRTATVYWTNIGTVTRGDGRHTYTGGASNAFISGTRVIDLSPSGSHPPRGLSTGCPIPCYFREPVSKWDLSHTYTYVHTCVYIYIWATDEEEKTVEDRKSLTFFLSPTRTRAHSFLLSRKFLYTPGLQHASFDYPSVGLSVCPR